MGCTVIDVSFAAGFQACSLDAKMEGLKRIREWTKIWAQDLTVRDQPNSPAPKRQKRVEFQPKPNGKFKYMLEFPSMEKEVPKIQAMNLENSMRNQLQGKQLPQTWAKEMIACVIKCLLLDLRKIVGHVEAQAFTDSMMRALSIPVNGYFQSG